MQRCWHVEPGQRPTFQTIAREISRLLITAENEVPVLRDITDLVDLAQALTKRPKKLESDAPLDDDGYEQHLICHQYEFHTCTDLPTIQSEDSPGTPRAHFISSWICTT